MCIVHAQFKRTIKSIVAGFTFIGILSIVHQTESMSIFCSDMTDVEKSEISPHVEDFQIFHTTDVEKCEILPNLEKFPHDRCD